MGEMAGASSVNTGGAAVVMAGGLWGVVGPGSSARGLQVAHV